MSHFLTMIRRRFERTNERHGDPVPWRLDDKEVAYEFAARHGFAVAEHERFRTSSEALHYGKDRWGRFVIKQPNSHSAQGVYVLEPTADHNVFLDVLSLSPVSETDIQHRGNAPAYWLVEQSVGSTVAGRPIPFDYKFYCFNGQPALTIQIDRNVSPCRVAVFDGTFFPLEHGRDYTLDSERWVHGGHVIPRYAASLVVMAARLAEACNSSFVSVDTYDSPRGPLFGEFTFAPGAPDTGMIRFSEEVAASLDARLVGEPGAASLSGFDIDSESLVGMASDAEQSSTMSLRLHSLVAATGANEDRRYGRVFSQHVDRTRVGAHFRLGAALIGFLNGDGEQAFAIQSAIARNSGFLVGHSRLAEFQNSALSYHMQRWDNGRHPWHSCRAAEVQLAQGNRAALAVLERFAAAGYSHAKRVLAGLGSPSQS